MSISRFATQTVQIVTEPLDVNLGGPFLRRVMDGSLPHEIWDECTQGLKAFVSGITTASQSRIC